MPLVDFTASFAGATAVAAAIVKTTAFAAAVAGSTIVTASGDRHASFSAVHHESRTVFGASCLTYRSFESRPVFEFDKDWSADPAEPFTYNLREILLGFAAPSFQRLQKDTIQGFEFSMLLEDESALSDFEGFASKMRGRLNGFWIASPFTEFEISSGISSTQFLIEDQGFRDYFDSHPSAFISFTKPGLRPQFGKVVAVEDNNNGKEKITLDSALAAPVDETWDAVKLLYVRFSDDTEDGDFLADNVQTRKIRVIELPEEYAAIETAQEPVYLYEFFMNVDGTPVYWRATGLNQDFISIGDTFTSRGIEHKNHIDSITGDQDSVEISSLYEDWNPITWFFPFRAPLPIWLRIYEVAYAVPDTRTVLFVGRVEEPKFQGRLISAKCNSFLDVLGRRFPRMLLQPRCNYFIYSSPCGVDQTLFRTSVTISRITGHRVTVSGASATFTGAAANYFALGWIKTGSGQDIEIRSIDTSSAESGGRITLTLTAPLVNAQVGQVATIFAGCDGSAAVCNTKFSNFRRWGGHVISPTNPTVRAMASADSSSGNKK